MSVIRVGLRCMVALCAIASLITSDVSAQNTDQQQLPTIADCPRGYVLAVQDTADPQLSAAAQNNDPSTYRVEGKLQHDAEQAAQQAAAPRAFVTGCILPQQFQQQQR